MSSFSFLIPILNNFYFKLIFFSLLALLCYYNKIHVYTTMILFLIYLVLTETLTYEELFNNNIELNDNVESESKDESYQNLSKKNSNENATSKKSLDINELDNENSPVGKAYMESNDSFPIGYDKSYENNLFNNV